MQRGVLLVAVLGVGGCAAPAARTTAIRPLQVSPVPINGSAAERIAYAEAQLALGNVALALESFRRAARQEPDNVRALLGTAQCYDAMERFDLARRNYEAALALAPGDVAILSRLAVSLTRAGDVAEAAQLRGEIARRSGSSVSLALPAAWAEQVAPNPNDPVVRTEVAVARSEPTPARGPHLERLSLGEVALVTAGPVRWAALGSADAPPAAVRILNAARRAGLAAEVRSAVARLGLRRLSIGDAATARQTSLVVYPAGGRALAERLARKVGAKDLRQGHGSEIVMLLGRDLTLPGPPRAYP